MGARVVSVSANPQRRIEGKYEILRKIREGGMGAIYKVRHRLLDEVRVVKLMRPQLVEDAEFRARFIREARVAIKLRHPNVAHLYDFTLGDDDTAFIVMEFIDGKNLDELLRAGTPPLPLALEIAQQSLRALGYLHGKGFVHRDISPDNLMLAEDPDGNPLVKLIDLGIAKVVDEKDSHLTRTGAFLGKLRYAAPEQFGAAGTTALDARADLYSFGLVLYELLTGVFPIAGSDASSLIAGHLFRPPLPFDETDPRQRLPAALRDVVLKALAKDPDQRFAGARELAQELAAFRQPGDLRPEDWKWLLAEDLDATASLPASRTSGIQHRLDEHFGPHTTPAPAPLFAVAVQAAEATEHFAAEPAAAPAAAAPEPSAATAPAAPAGGPDTLQPLLDNARELLAAGRWKEAGRAARRAARMAPGDPAVLALRALLDETTRHRGEERRRTAQIERRAAEIGSRLDRGDLDGGDELLARAAADFGEAGPWPALRERLDALRAKVRLAQVGALLMSARQRLARGDLAEASEQVAAAGRLEPGNPGVEALAAELDTATSQRDKERRRSERLAQTVTEVASHLEHDQLAEASQLLDWAVVRFGATAELRNQWEQLEQRKRRQRELAEQRRAEDLLRDARLLLKIESYEEAARKLTRLLDLQPNHAAAKTLLDQARAALGQQPPSSHRRPPS
jgi:eukaryotic-like serine/threonine-protein kinase